PTGGTTGPSTPPAPTVWRRIDATGPSARRDHSFTGDPVAGVAFLFGGRDAAGTALGDFWIFTAATAAWERVTARGPSPRFGHNAEVTGGRLVLFGGQAAPREFFNDVWEYDRTAGAWLRLTPKAPRPAQRYGAGSAVVDDRLLVTHGFTDSGRFDDTWRLGANAWENASPAAGPRPVKRCLHRTAWWPGAKGVALFGGQTNNTAFLGDFWLYDPAAKRWRQVQHQAPPQPRNLHAMFVLSDRLWVVGGAGADGPLGSLAHIGAGQTTWNNLETPPGAVPQARSGIEAAVMGPKRALIFGGRGASGDLSDLWEFTDVI
ncbi:MAG: Kelch repeat-containing protein, partial [Actinomycetota bacterium]